MFVRGVTKPVVKRIQEQRDQRSELMQELLRTVRNVKVAWQYSLRSYVVVLRAVRNAKVAWQYSLRSCTVCARVATTPNAPSCPCIGAYYVSYTALPPFGQLSVWEADWEQRLATVRAREMREIALMRCGVQQQQLLLLLY
jgi:hypothetical protein